MAQDLALLKTTRTRDKNHALFVTRAGNREMSSKELP